MPAHVAQSTSFATTGLLGPGVVYQSQCLHHPLQVAQPVEPRSRYDHPTDGEAWMVRVSIHLPFLTMVEEDEPDILSSVPLFGDAIKAVRDHKKFKLRPCIVTKKNANKSASRKSKRDESSGPNSGPRDYKVWPCATFEGELYQNLSRVMQHFIVGIYTTDEPHLHFRHIHACPEWRTSTGWPAYVLGIPMTCSLTNDSFDDVPPKDKRPPKTGHPLLEGRREDDSRFSADELEELEFLHLAACMDWAQYSRDHRWTAMLEIWEVCFTAKNGPRAWKNKTEEALVAKARKTTTSTARKAQAAREALVHELRKSLQKQGRRGKEVNKHVTRVFGDRSNTLPSIKPQEDLEEGEIGYEFPSRRPTRHRVHSTVNHTVPIHSQ
ncbi:hypothetical protein PENSPDRAFT_752793 [Peniophora sp. CONT]|nr:hypothetical protein PENSPDRAFT_752793 [Peniophora sp. CONT]